VFAVTAWLHRNFIVIEHMGYPAFALFDWNRDFARKEDRKKKK
jgi:hypothetical protein